MTNINKIIFLLVLALGMATTQAEKVADLANVELEVADRSSKERERGFIDAFIEVLIRMSGDQQFLQHYPLKLNLQKVRPYILSYRYEQIEKDDEEKTMLLLRFDEKSVENLLKEMGARIWGKNRPLGLVWIAIEEGRERQFINADNAPELTKAFLANSQRRGLPIILPTLDLQDQSALRVSDVRGQFEETIAKASERYGANTVVAAHLQKMGDYWLAKWLVLDRCANQRWRWTEFKTPDEVFAVAVDALANFLGECYGVDVGSDAGQQVRMKISNISDTLQYGRALEFLEKLSLVKRVDVVATQEDFLIVDVAIIGDDQALEQAIRLGGRMQRVEPALTPETEQVRVNYQWSP